MGRVTVEELNILQDNGETSKLQKVSWLERCLLFTGEIYGKEWCLEYWSPDFSESTVSHYLTCNLFHQSMTASLMVFFMTSVAALALSASVISGALCFLLTVPIFLDPIVFYKNIMDESWEDKILATVLKNGTTLLSGHISNRFTSVAAHIINLVGNE